MEASTAPGVAATPPAQPPPEELTPEEIAALSALVLALLSGMSGAALIGYAGSLFAPLGIAPAAVAEAVAFTTSAAALLPPLEDGGQAVRQVARTSRARRAAYLLKASRRLDVPEDRLIATRLAERRYLGQHLDAERRRVDAADRVDVAAGRWGPVLGWRAVNDARTTEGCRGAHGKNFRVDEPPRVEGQPVFPGQLHGGACRCEPGPPWPGGELLLTIQADDAIELAFDPGQLRDWHGRWARQWIGPDDALAIAGEVLGLDQERLQNLTRRPGLESALAAPFAGFEGHEAHPGAAAKAAVVCSRVIRNHPFPDGNKRVGLLLLHESLSRGGFELRAGQEEQAETIEALASGELPEAEFTAWVGARTREREYPVDMAKTLIGRIFKGRAKPPVAPARAQSGRGSDAEFKARLQRLMAENREALDRLA